jgi:capsid protein
MGILQSLVNLFSAKKKEVAERGPEASYGYGRTLYVKSYDGEKNLGEIGPVYDYVLDHEVLRMRSWQAYLESEIAQTVLKKYSLWHIGKGLRLQAEPLEEVLKSEGITFDAEDFNEITEARFKAYSGSRIADYSDMRSLDKIARIAFVNAIIGGDVLVVLRYEEGSVKVQLIDGAHVCSPYLGSDLFGTAKNSGHKIIHGVEVDAKGKHVRYYVRKPGVVFNYDVYPVEARNSFGQVTAFMVYGMDYRIDNTRGIPLISTVLESLKKLERYKEATVGSAEERQKIILQVVHQAYSDGENPMAKQLAKAFNAEAGANDLPEDIRGTQLANTVAATTNKSAFNMPVGAEMKTLESKNELYFKDFYTVNIDIVCAVIGIPPNVAMSKYDSNFSAARAAIKDWEHTLQVNRKDFSEQFYQNIYNFWLDIEVLNNRIQAPGYLMALLTKVRTVLDAYRNARFAGANVPHIDPLKEVNAERAKLGKAAENIPLATVESATEALNEGDSDSNMRQFAKEYEYAKELNIPVITPVAAPPENPAPEEE